MFYLFGLGLYLFIYIHLLVIVYRIQSNSSKKFRAIREYCCKNKMGDFLWHVYIEPFETDSPLCLLVLVFSFAFWPCVPIFFFFTWIGIKYFSFVTSAIDAFFDEGEE